MQSKKIVLVSPAAEQANNGNWHTAYRWAGFASKCCEIELLQEWPGSSSGRNSNSNINGNSSAMVALHARRSASSVHAWAEKYPDKPLVVVLTGTDLYRDIAVDADAQRSLAVATHLVLLQDAGLEALPAEYRHKTRVIYQSAPKLVPAKKSNRRFKAVMVGHLRDEKDPLTFMAAACAPEMSALYFDQIGDGLDPALAAAARNTAEKNPRYHWWGGLPRADTRQRIKRAHVLVNSSVMEGGAHVILEAVQSATPVLASRISGNLGMLGPDYAGYFDVGNVRQLTALLRQCTDSHAFLRQLSAQCQRRASLFAPTAEKREVLKIFTEITASVR